ncbi:hypothetical protein AB5I41_18785 [Sphingomonas sp. MMS24-JH45]
MWQLMARMYGNQNLPDSSNMCQRIDLGRAEGRDRRPRRHGAARGFRAYQLHPALRPERRDQQPADAPPAPLRAQARRRAHRLQPAQGTRAGALHRSPEPDRDGHRQGNADRHPISSGEGRRRSRRDDGDRQKWLVEHDRVDPAFIAEHTHDYAAFAAKARATGWDEIERKSGLTRADLEKAAATYANAKAVIAIYGMGLTQHVKGVEKTSGCSST